MNLTPQQSALLQYYMQKNRQPIQAAQAPQLGDMPAGNTGGSSGPGLLSILGTVGGWMDTPNAEVSGPLQPGQIRPTATRPSSLTQFVNRADPQAAMIKQYMAMLQKQNPNVLKSLMSMI